MEAYYNCLHCKNKRVRIMTTDGKRHEGVIVDVDQNNVYLKTKGNGKMKTSAFYPGGAGNYYGGTSAMAAKSLHSACLLCWPLR